MIKCNVSSRLTASALSRMAVISFAVALFFALSGMLSPAHGQWPKTIIEDGLNYPGELFIADMDADNDSDLVAAIFKTKDLVLYVNGNPSWHKQFINPNHDGAFSLDVADMNGDNLPDVIAGSWTQVYWYRNPSWSQNTIATNTGYANDMEVIDLDDDGDLDMVAVWIYPGFVYWYENTGSGWTPKPIDLHAHFPAQLEVADIDGDNTLDVVITEWVDFAGAVIWYKGPNWDKFVIDDSLEFAYGLDVADLDADNDIDVVAPASENVWYRNDGGFPIIWSSITIDAELDSTSWPRVADINNDGTLDVVLNYELDNSIFWYEGPTWTRHLITDNHVGAAYTEIGDMDNDGDLDVVAVGYRAGGDVVLYRNPGGAVIKVPGDHATIQAGINAASDGDVVLVDDGTYYENINFKGKAITVASQYWADGDTNHVNNTIINGSRPSHPDSGSVVYFISGEDTNSVLTGFTITGGRGTLTLWPSFPGFIDKDGGGIYVRNSGAKIEKNKITQNHITAAGDTTVMAAGMFVAGEVGDYIVIRNNDISRNTATATGVNLTGLNGGAGNTVYLMTKATCVFEKNRVIQNVCNSNNWANGGGLAIDGTLGSQGPYIIRDNIISGNKVLNGPRINGGGGVVIGNASPILTNNIISGNVARIGGGFWILHNPSYTGITKPVLINNTITNNSATERGGGILFKGYPQTDAIVMNTILWGNSAARGSQIWVDAGSIAVRYSDVQGGWSGEGTNIDADPQFADNSFRLAKNSPCIGAGTHSYDFGGGTICYCPNTDISGKPRPWPANSKPDMGAMESDLATEVAFRDQNAIPRVFALSQNYPNPFNPSTAIEFALPKASFVTLKIYDLLGNEVATLVAEKLPAGKHQRVWEAKGLASGVYLYRLEAGDPSAGSGRAFTQTRKLILLR